MKVLFLSCESGVQRPLSAYSHRLEKLRHGLEQHGVETDFFSLRDLPFGRPILAQPLSLPLIRRKVADCDFIHAGDLAAFSAALFKPHTKARVIYDVHGHTPSATQVYQSVRKDLRSAFWVVQSRIVDAVACRYSDYFLTVCKPLTEWLVREKRISRDRIALVRNGVDLKLFLPLPRNRNGSFVVSYAGAFQPYQGIDLLVKAAASLPRDGLRLRMIGFSSSEQAIRRQIAQSLGDKVELVDRVNQAELISHLAAADVLIIPRHPVMEMDFPTKFSEYLALGRPVIVCDVDETAQLVREHGCGLVSKPEPASLAETIWAAAHLSQDELDLMGRKARQLAENEFSYDRISQKYAEQLVQWQRSAVGA